MKSISLIENKSNIMNRNTYTINEGIESLTILLSINTRNHRMILIEECLISSLYHLIYIIGLEYINYR